MGWVQELRSGPDWETVTIRREGELLVARVRLWTAAVSALLPIFVLTFDLRQPEAWIGLAGALAMMGVSILFKRLAEGPEPPRLLGLFTTIADVSIVSAGNAAFVLAGQPLAATSGRVYFSIYLLALAFTCIRHDVRLCLIAGATAIVQYTLIVFWALRSIDPAQITSYSAFRWDNQLARLAVLAFATAINVAIVQRGRLFMTAALQDLLTGLANRRYAEARLQEALAIARRARRTLVVAIGDLDAFKGVNDRHGHAAGDEVLRETGRRLREFCRSTDMVARYGGEEFLMAMLDAEADGAVHRIQEFQQAFASTPMVLPNGATVSVTMSIGVASFPRDALTVEELVAVADARMYAAKHAPRAVVYPLRAAPRYRRPLAGT